MICKLILLLSPSWRILVLIYSLPFPSCLGGIPYESTTLLYPASFPTFKIKRNSLFALLKKERKKRFHLWCNCIALSNVICIGRLTCFMSKECQASASSCWVTFGSCVLPVPIVPKTTHRHTHIHSHSHSHSHTHALKATWLSSSYCAWERVRRDLLPTSSPPKISKMLSPHSGPSWLSLEPRTSFIWG